MQKADLCGGVPGYTLAGGQGKCPLQQVTFSLVPFGPSCAFGPLFLQRKASLTTLLYRALVTLAAFVIASSRNLIWLHSASICPLLAVIFFCMPTATFIAVGDRVNAQ